MTLDELAARLAQLVFEGHGDKEVLDTDGHPIISANVGEYFDTNKVYLEAEF